MFIQDFEPATGVAYDAVWIQWVAMYLGDDEFIQVLKKLKTCLSANARVFIRENCRAENPTCLAEGEFAGKKDEGLTRGYDCFDYIFK